VHLLKHCEIATNFHLFSDYKEALVVRILPCQIMLTALPVLAFMFLNVVDTFITNNVSAFMLGSVGCG